MNLINRRIMSRLCSIFFQYKGMIYTVNVLFVGQCSFPDRINVEMCLVLCIMLDLVVLYPYKELKWMFKYSIVILKTPNIKLYKLICVKIYKVAIFLFY